MGETEKMETEKFKPRVNRIKGLSERRRLPRLGVIRLGLKAKSKKSGKEYPVETEYFVCPQEVEGVFGKRPKELEVMLPLNNLESVFPTAYKWYGTSKGLKCTGDGVKADRYNEETKEWESRTCPCDYLDSGKCKPSGTLMVILPKVSMGGIYQIRTSSINSIIDINSGIDYVASLLDGRFALVPLTLRRVKTETYHDDKKASHFTLQIIFDADLATVAHFKENARAIIEHPRYQLPEPKDENPAAEPVDIEVDDEEKAAVDLAQVIEVTGTLAVAQAEIDKMAEELPKPAPPAHDAAPKSLFDEQDISYVVIDFTKKKAHKGYELGANVRCPDRPVGEQSTNKAICNACQKSAGCPAWE